MSFQDFEGLLLIGMAGMLVSIVGYSISKLIDILTDIRDSISQLNLQIAVVINKQDDHEDRLVRLEEK